MKTKILLTILTIAILSSPLFAQRDSLCMAEHMNWYNPDSAIGYFSNMVVNGDYIYGSRGVDLFVFFLADSGFISLDTTFEFSSGIVSLSPIYQDSLIFLNCRSDLIILNVSNPALPESIYTYPDFVIGRERSFARDSILYVLYASYETETFIKRYDITNPLEMSEITTYHPRLWTSLQAFSYPYVYGSTGFFFEEMAADLNIVDVRGADTLQAFCYFEILNSSEPAVDATMLSARDSFIFSPEREGAIRAYKFSRDINIVEEISRTRGTGHYLTDHSSYLFNDTLLVTAWFVLGLDAAPVIHVFNVADPYDVRRIGYHESDEEDDGEYITFAIKDSFIVASYRYGLRVFKFPCTDCDGNCELEYKADDIQIDIYPNPFNKNCKIALKKLPEKQKYSDIGLKIFDIRGREVFTARLTDDRRELNWYAGSRSAGIYIVNFQLNNSVWQKRIVLL